MLKGSQVATSHLILTHVLNVVLMFVNALGSGLVGSFVEEGVGGGCGVWVFRGSWNPFILVTPVCMYLHVGGI